MEKENYLMQNDIEKFPEFEDIRNAILDARKKVTATVNIAMVAAYWNVGKRLYDAQIATDSIYVMGSN